MGVQDNNYSINALTTSNTFYEWMQKTNDEIITKLNLLKVYQGLSGDGVVVGVTANGGLYGFSIAPTIAKGITFNGPINFNNTVSFNSATNLTTVAIKFPLTAGLTSGNVVRIDPTTKGLTFAIANSEASSEVFGVVSHNTGSETVVKIAGTVDNLLFPNTINNMLKGAGSTLAPGIVYFLDSTTYGGLTTNDQVTYGTVSKPMVLGITGDSGCILPYRGISNNGVTAGITADLDNNSYSMNLWTTIQSNGANVFTDINNIDVGSYVFLPKNFEWCVGDGVQAGETQCIRAFSTTADSFTPDFIFINDTACVRSAMDTYSASNNITANNDIVFFGIVSKIYEKDTSTGRIAVQITTDGGGFILDSTELTNLSSLINNPLGADRYYRSTLLFDKSSTPNKFVTRTSSLNVVVGTVSITEGFGVVGIPVSSSSVCFRVIRQNYGKNLITVYSGGGAGAGLVGGGDFEGEVENYALAPLTGGLSGGVEYDNLLINGTFDVWQRGYSGITGLNSKCTPVSDRWFKIDRDYTATGLTHGKAITNYSITRQQFTNNQTEVYGSPKYYLSLVHHYSGTTGYNKPRLENVTYNPYQFQANTLTLSFYARSGITGGTLACYYTQYEDLSDFTDKTTVNNISTIDLGSTWSRYSVPFTVSPPGFTGSASNTGLFGIGFEFVSDPQAVDIANVRLDMGSNPGYDIPCDIDREINRCSPYYFKTYPHDILPGTPDSTTHQELTLGNLQTVKDYVVKYPIKTITAPNSITIYSNKTGDVNEAYNVSAGSDMKMTSGSVSVCPWSAALRGYRVARLNAPTIIISNYNNTQMFVNIQNGAFSLDTLQFHYVIDADVYMTN